MDVVISGYFLTKQINGIPRYAYEVVKHLDGLVGKDGYGLVVPADIAPEKIPALKNIEIIQGSPLCKAWEIRCPEQYAKKQKALYVNLCSQAVFYKNSIVCLHDIRPLTWDKEHHVRLKRKYVYGIKCRAIARYAEKVVTVSEWSKKEMADMLHVAPDKITVIPNGWEHIVGIQEDEGIFARFPQIRKGDYFFSLGSIAPHKNFKWILEMALKYPKEQFVIAGGMDKSIWKDSIDFSKCENLVFTGYVSDGEMKALMAHTKMLLFPSYYEGFGIPPLEALALKVPAACSDIPVLREVYGDAVRYFSPDDLDVRLKDLEKSPAADADAVLRKYSWENAAKAWKALICAIAVQEA